MSTPVSLVPPKAEGKELMLAVARDAFLQRGYGNVSMQQIAEAAGMTKGAPYYHFKSKDDLFLSVFRAEILSIEQAMFLFLDGPGSLRERLTGATQNVMETARGDLNQLIADYEFHIQQAEPDAEFEQIGSEIESRMVPYFAAAREQGEFSRVAPEVAISYYLMVLMAHVRMYQHKPRSGLNNRAPAALARDLVDLLFDGIS